MSKKRWAALCLASVVAGWVIGVVALLAALELELFKDDAWP
jgi:hypothetical protein